MLGVFSAFGVLLSLVVEMSETVKSKRSRQTLDRWARRFREAFPEYSMPSVLWASVRDEVMGDAPKLFADELDADVISLKIGAAHL